MSAPVKLLAIFTKAETLTDNSVKLIFVTREMGGADTAVLFGMKGQELWLLLSSTDSFTEADIPQGQPATAKRRNTPSQRLRFTLRAYWEELGAPGTEFEQWYAEQIDRLVQQINFKIETLLATKEDN